MNIKSNFIAADGRISEKYTCTESNISPPLQFESVPGEAESLTVILDDPDAPGGIFTHWLIYNIQADQNHLEENIRKQGVLEDNARHGRNSFGDIGYGGPCPPPGSEHRYYLRLYALDISLEAGPGVSRKELLNLMEGHIVEQTELMGRFSR